MTFDELLEQVLVLLQRDGRVAYRVLKRRFGIDDEYVEDLKADLIDAKRVAADEDGKVLVWGGEQRVVSSQFSVASPQPPAAYTPPHLAERIRAEQAALEARGATDGERKTITALFADLKGSTALIEGLDPEEARAIIDPALQLMMDAVHRYEGYVAQALGDGIFALFGAPIAHEDHPQRTLYAALRMQEEMRRYADTLRQKGHPPLLMRVGVNTGEVVVRSIRKDDLHADYVPVGHSTNLAARMEQLAAPGSILVTAYTHKLTDGYFEFKDLGQTQIKGVEEPLNIYEMLRVGPLRTKLQVAARRGLTRFVGRQREMEQLQAALTKTKASHGQIVGVIGEPGLGKSRLFYEFKLTSQSGCLLLEAYSVSHGKASPYLPVLELLKSYFQIQPQDDERTRRQKVIGKVLELDRSLEDTLPYLFALLSVDDQQSNLAQMDAQIRRRRTFAALKKVFLRESLNQPLILIFEDLHWIDSETQGVLDTLSEGVASAKVLVLVNYRPEYRHEWGQKTYYTQLRLAPLGRTEAEEFLDELLGMTVGTQPAASLQDLKRLILEKTEGTPFFMEEIVQELFERDVLVRDGVGARLRLGSFTGQVPFPTDLHIPTTVQGVLAARIDRLVPEEKALLQQLAVIGREFPVSLIRQVIAQPEDELYRLLASLQRKEFLYEQPAFPEVEYFFKHALTQEVAYGTVLQDKRKALHERTAQAIETLYKDNLDDHYSELAHHYSRSGNTQKAVDYLQLAGQQAVQRSANEEAIAHLTSALELLETLPSSPARILQELMLQISLGATWMTARGFSAPETKSAYTRAWELCQRVGETPQIGPILWALSLFDRIRGEHGATREPTEQLLFIAQHQQDPVLLLAGHTLLGSHLQWTGNLIAARTHLEQGLRFHDLHQQKSVWMSYGVDLGVLCVTDLALVLWCCGYPAQAWKKIQEALSLGHELAHPHSLVLARCWSAWLHQLCRRHEQILQEPTDAAITIAADQGLSFYSGILTVVRGWALAKQGSREEGLTQIDQGIVLYRTSVGEHNVPYFLALLAETQSDMGRSQEAAQSLTNALAVAEKNGEHFYEAELHRLKGQLTLQSQASLAQVKTSQSRSEITSPQPLAPSPQAEAEAEACFHKAIEVARHQQAKSLELRATTSLARLWQQQGKKKETYELLAPVYAWFTEGFDTKDLQEAKALLEELT